MDALFDIWVWSLKHLAAGTFPDCRHDGRAWTSTDAKRALTSGNNLNIKAALVHVACDWKFLKEVLRLPGWNESRCICFNCPCTPAQLRQVDMQAPWRNSRLDHWALVHRLLLCGHILSPLFAIPWFDAQTCIKLDWLHIADLGITPDFLGASSTWLAPHTSWAITLPTAARRCGCRSKSGTERLVVRTGSTV